jgi:phosphoribosylformylglycinamidine synthase
MWQLSETVDGMAEGCNALGLPIIGGNVSLYNESGGKDIDPTPVIGVLGLVETLTTPPPGWTWSEGETVIVVGNAPADPSLAGSRWATAQGRRGGALPAFDAALLGATSAFIAQEVSSICAGNESDLTAVHDIAGGGLVGAIAEIASVSGVGLDSSVITRPVDLLVETPGRFIIATSNPEAFVARAAAAGVTTTVLGEARGTVVKLGEAFSTHVATIAERRGGALDRSMRAAG